jgi:hypothetical protein
VAPGILFSAECSYSVHSPVLYTVGLQSPITAMGFFGNVYLLALDNIRGKYCRRPIAVMGVVDTLGQRNSLSYTNIPNPDF